MIDTVCLFPVMRGPRLVFQHDYQLFRKQPLARGVGPKILFDQFPESHRARTTANQGNLFWTSLDLDQARFEEIVADALSIPWTLTKRLQPEQVSAFRAVLTEHFSAELVSVFDARVERFNVPTGRLYRDPAN